MHRDLKLENILLDAHGNIKVSAWHGLGATQGELPGLEGQGVTTTPRFPQGMSFPELWQRLERCWSREGGQSLAELLKP